jgi:hypothetical protein
MSPFSAGKSPPWRVSTQDAEFSPHRTVLLTQKKLDIGGLDGDAAAVEVVTVTGEQDCEGDLRS